MSASDLFHDAASTHHVLVGLLLVETGLFGAPPCHPERQHECLVACFEGVRARLLAPEWTEKGAIRLQPFLEVAVARQEDARLFRKLYSGLNNLAELGVTTEKQLELAAYPLVRDLVRAKPEVHAILADASRDHVEQHGAAVGVRIRRSLKTLFDLESIADAPPAAALPARR